MTSVSSYLPDATHVAGVGIAWLVAALLALAGTTVLGRRLPIEIRLLAGWGLLCILLTLWGTLTTASLRWPAALFTVIALACLGSAARRPSRADFVACGRIVVLSLPLWVILAPIRPSQPDTFLNLLPNALYLVDHDMLPADGRAALHSFLPAAPYNSQFAAYLGGLLWPDFPESGMSLFNLVLQLAGGLLLARRIAGPPAEAGAAPSWGASAAGILLAMALNPGFVPRISLAAYGEPAEAVTALAAAWLALDILGPTSTRRDGALAFGLILAAMINTKQSGIGLAAASLLAAAAVVPVRMTRADGAILARALAPAALIYGVWRVYALTAFTGAAELQPLPFAEWQWHNLPVIFARIGRTIVQKPAFFVPALAVTAAGMVRPRWLDPAGRKAARCFAVLFIAYTGFLVVTYIGEFSGQMSTDAHSFFRYQTHLSLVLVMAVIEMLRAAQPLRRAAATGWARAAAIVLCMLLPIGFAGRLRFDLAEPQPLVWALAKRVAAEIPDGARLALLLPGDNGSLATMLEGVIEQTPPRRRGLEMMWRPDASAATLAGAAASGYQFALVSCSSALAWSGSVGALPARAAVLLRRNDGGWHPAAIWPWDEAAYRSRWQHIVAAAPLCRADTADDEVE